MAARGCLEKLGQYYGVITPRVGVDRFPGQNARYTYPSLVQWKNFQMESSRSRMNAFPRCRRVHDVQKQCHRQCINRSESLRKEYMQARL